LTELEGEQRVDSLVSTVAARDTSLVTVHSHDALTNLHAMLFAACLIIFLMTTKKDYSVNWVFLQTKSERYLCALFIYKMY